MSERTDKLNTQKKSDHQLPDNYDAKNMATEGHDTSRREFTRNVLVGSAVLLTLTNRSAWGLMENPVKCISTNLLMSYRNGQASGLTAEQQEEVRQFEEYLSEATADSVNVGDDTCIEISSDSETDEFQNTFHSFNEFNKPKLWFNKDYKK